MNRGLEHLLPKTSRGSQTPETRAALEEERLQRKEHSFVADLLKSLGWSAGKVAAHSNQFESGCLNFYWLQDEGLIIHHFDWSEVKAYDIHRLFDTPTKTDVFEKYVGRRKDFEKAFRSHWRDELIMPFSCRNMSGGYYAVHDNRWLKERSRTFLTFIVRGKEYYIQTWKSVLGVVRDVVAS